ncbi:uncharacterized protein LTR77_001700 [Saxophila tyrrhenica]|uniref:INO80 complex subunit F domain-containing protein n=1 Tax=Saxophila tyrrhenica TaxID=1690608 RepID=A0AAV9PQQ3_9PEZI|nr:hypothetical protein LTR77_001700 [Saxophila tyrrhenica]
MAERHAAGAPSTQNTPLPPSVEKAYYRKCIELKRRLNEVEAANDEMKLRRVRQDRGVMKMRLQRAYLLDHLRKMMEHTTNVEGSEGSADEGMNTPPVDRPHRDKRRRHLPPTPSAPQPAASSHAHQPAPFAPPARVPSQPEVGGTPMTMPGQGGMGGYGYQPQYEQQRTPSGPPPQQYTPQAAPPIPASPYGPPPPARTNGALEHDREREAALLNRTPGSTMPENGDGERRVVSSAPAENANAENSQLPEAGASAFTSTPKATNEPKKSPGSFASAGKEERRENKRGSIRGYRQSLYKQLCRCMDSQPCACGLREEEEIAKFRASRDGDEGNGNSEAARPAKESGKAAAPEPLDPAGSRGIFVPPRQHHGSKYGDVTDLRQLDRPEANAPRRLPRTKVGPQKRFR